jgi:Autographiviridae endonuclease VII
MKNKKCTNCNLEKDLSNFGKLKHGKHGLRPECKQCCKDKNALYYLNNKDKINKRCKEWSINNKEAVRFYYVKRMYRITKKDWESLLLKQNNRCAICNIYSKDKSFFCTDHCHEGGQVRGLLCRNCNTVLGHAKDNINILEKAIEYLKIHGK